MNVISAYLDTMFSTYPASARMLEAKAELHGMMEDAYAGYRRAGLSENEAVGRVITEFGNLDELAPVLGIATDITSGADASESAMQHRVPLLTPQEAQLYAEARQRTEPRLGLAVALLVASPAALVALSTLGNAAWTPFTSSVGSLVGLAVLLGMVLAGVIMLVNRAQLLAPFGNITSGSFQRSPGVEVWARSLAQNEAPRRTRRLQVAISLFVLAALPPIVFSLALTGDTANALSGVGVALTLLMVATGLLIFLPANWAAATFEALSRDGGTSDGDTGIVGVIAAIYWPLLTTIFLAWGLIGDAWDRAWIIWPIGAVLFGAIAGGVGAFAAYRKSRT